MELPDPVVVMKGALPPIGAALVLVSAFGSRLTALAMAAGVFTAYWLLRREQPAWPHELWFAPDGRQWLLWGLIAVALVALLEHARLLRGKVAATAAMLVTAFAAWLVLRRLSVNWNVGELLVYVGGGGLIAALVLLSTRTAIARAPASIAPAVVLTLLLSAEAVLLTLARSGLFGQLCGAVAAALGAAAATSVWRKPFTLAPADGTWIGGSFALFLLASKHLADLGWEAAGCAAVAPCALFLLRPGAAARPFWWAVGAVLLAGIPMAGAFWFTLQADTGQ